MSRRKKCVISDSPKLTSLSVDSQNSCYLRNDMHLLSLFAVSNCVSQLTIFVFCHDNALPQVVALDSKMWHQAPSGRAYPLYFVVGRVHA